MYFVEREVGRYLFPPTVVVEIQLASSRLDEAEAMGRDPR